MGNTAKNRMHDSEAALGSMEAWVEQLREAAAKAEESELPIHVADNTEDEGFPAPENVEIADVPKASDGSFEIVPVEDEGLDLPEIDVSGGPTRASSCASTSEVEAQELVVAPAATGKEAAPRAAGEVRLACISNSRDLELKVDFRRGSNS